MCAAHRETNILPLLSPKTMIRADLYPLRSAAVERRTAAWCRPAAWRRSAALLLGTLLALPAVAVLSGCGGAAGAANSSAASLAITPGISSLDTNCTGCNAASGHGAAVQQFAALLANGSPAPVTWSVTGGDKVAGPGTIDASGRYTPPSYLTSDRADVMVTARLQSNPAIAATARVAIAAGFLEPLAPENAALGPEGTLAVTAKLAEAGGHAGIRFALADSAAGVSGGLGTLGGTSCEHGDHAFTTCTVTYTAPPNLAGTGVTYLVALAGATGAGTSRTETEILLNTAGVTSNPVGHQGLLPTLMPLGSSGGNNADFDAHGNTIADCCSGTLGALVEDSSGRQYVLSNNHVLARSDHAAVGDAIVQPGLIDNNCTPNGDGPGTVPVATLSEWVPLKSAQTNVDAAIAQVASRTVDATGSILELGARQPDGTLAAAPPGISSTGGKGEPATLHMRVAKSGRTTGLTCGGVSAVDLDVAVDYFSDCAETRPYTTKVFTNQVAISGDRFSDAGDSGALVVDATTGEPVGLFFAGGTDAAGVGQGVANPAASVLNELGAAAGSSASFTFVGGADHPVSCLSYGNSTVGAAQAMALPDAEIARGQQALFTARGLVNPAAGILGVSMGKSSDRPGEAAVIVYVDDSAKENVPATIEGVRTMVIAATPEAVALGTAPLDNSAAGAPPLNGAALSRALHLKQQVARSLMRQNVAYFGVGVGQSLDNPREAALVVYVDRTRLPAHLPLTIDGVRTRFIVMDRLHVTRSYAPGLFSPQHCLSHRAAAETPDSLSRPRGLGFD